MGTVHPVNTNTEGAIESVRINGVMFICKSAKVHLVFKQNTKEINRTLASSN